MSGSPTTVAPKQRSRIRFPPELPISARVADITGALQHHQVVIVVGATGSGKTTQLPKIALEMGRGGDRRIGVTQPRRIAATSVAARVAQELECELGAEVGYQIRFEDRTGPDTWVKFMTDGILLAEIQGDRLLQAYDTLIIDEAHERNLTIDFLLGWLKRILPQRPDLKVIVSSATIATEQFSEFFDGAPVIQVEGRTFPVDVLYEPPASETDMPDAVADAVANVTSLDPQGDILVFLPGEREIRESEQALLARNLRHTEILPLYARLSAADQARIFARVPRRRVILATNVAETSLTIPGIVYVIDTGVARLSRYDPRTGTTRLQVEGISQASADQRKGRCGRVREGICVRLFDETSFEARPRFTDPEMRRTGLAGVILRMKSLGLGDVESFPFLDPPQPRAIAEGYRVLEELGALDSDRELTPLGRRLAQFPVDPRVARMILGGAEYDCLHEILVIAAVLNIQDPRERPRGKEAQADQLHARFRDERSDFVGLLRLWAFVHEAERKSHAQLRRACKDNFLSYVRIREWLELYRQLEDLAREQHVGKPPRRDGKNTREVNTEHSDRLHLALLTGLLSRIGQYHSEQRAYIGSRQTRFVLHPSSSLAKKPPAWVMVFELVETSQLFARMNARVEPEWLSQVGGHLMKRSYSDPHWSEKSARASVKEHATLFGLQVVKDRSVDYAAIAPARARMMFIEHALVRGEYQSRGNFQEKNRQLRDKIAQLADKARQSDMFADDERLYAFFDERLPDTIVNGKLFEAWRAAAEKSQPTLLHLRMQDVVDEVRRLRPEDYPDRITVHGVALNASYRFEPAADDDGVTLTVPLAFLPQLTPSDVDWTIPAWHLEKIKALLEELPRGLRRELVPIPETAATLATQVTPGYGGRLAALAGAIYDLKHVDIPVEALQTSGIPRYLRFNLRIVDPQGKVVTEGRDLAQMLEEHGARARAILRRESQTEKRPTVSSTTWEFGDLAPYVQRKVHGVELKTYPALLDRGNSVELGLLETETAANAEHRNGIRRLLALATRSKLSDLAKRVPVPFTRRLGMPIPRAECDSFREHLLSRVLDTAFALDEGAPLPRTKSAFTALLNAGTPNLSSAFDHYVAAVSAIAAEFEKLTRALEAATKHPSATAASTAIREQLDQLFPQELLNQVPLGQLKHYPRYLRAAQVRLSRAMVDPKKDVLKTEPFAPLWKAFREKYPSTPDRGEARKLQFAIEELRVAIYAPELKPALSVTIATLTRAVAALK